MSQLLTLLWLKWKLLRNSLRSRKAVVNQAASVFGMIVALALALGVALGLGAAAYGLSLPGGLSAGFRQGAAREGMSAEPMEYMFLIFAFIYLMWATVPLSIGSNKQFDAGRMLIYPISLRKLFAFDFLSEVTTLQSVFAIPSVITMCLGAGLGSGNLLPALLAAPLIILFGMALSKFLSTTVNSLVRRKRARGETIIALVGAVAGLGGALAGQLAPMILQHAESFRSLRWTPPGAAAYLLMYTSDTVGYVIAFVLLSGYSALLIIGTYWIARRAALGLGGTRKRKAITVDTQSAYTGWQLPVLSSDLSAVVEKELRYAFRNAQLRMMALMPMILIIIRLVNSSRFRNGGSSGIPSPSHGFVDYAAGLFSTGGVLYVFLLLAALACNLFAFDEGGMRTLILSPIDRRKILLGKNIAITVIALVFSTVLVTINAIVFRDVTLSTVLFVVLSFVCFASLMSLIGNSFSINFPRRMPFGKRMNLSGVAGLLLIPAILLMMIPPLSATVVGYYADSLFLQFVVLAACAALSLGMYGIFINFQGRTLARKEIEILEVVKEPAD